MDLPLQKIFYFEVFKNWSRHLEFFNKMALLLVFHAWCLLNLELFVTMISFFCWKIVSMFKKCTQPFLLIFTRLAVFTVSSKSSTCGKIQISNVQMTDPKQNLNRGTSKWPLPVFEKGPKNWNFVKGGSQSKKFWTFMPEMLVKVLVSGINLLIFLDLLVKKGAGPPWPSLPGYGPGPSK